MKTFFLFLGIFLLAASTEAAEMSIVTCHAQGPHITRLNIELFVDGKGKFGGRYQLNNFPVHAPTWVNFAETTTPPARLPAVIAQIDEFRKTGIDASKVTKFQNTFIDGSNTWDIELWKLMDDSNRVLGWTVWAYGKPAGCYEEASTLGSEK